MAKSSANIFMKAGKFLVVQLRAKNVFEKERTEKTGLFLKFQYYLTTRLHRKVRKKQNCLRRTF